MDNPENPQLIVLAEVAAPQECAVIEKPVQPLTVPKAPKFYRNLSKRPPYISASASAQIWSSQEGEGKEMVEAGFNDLGIESFWTYTPNSSETCQRSRSEKSLGTYAGIN